MSELIEITVINWKKYQSRIKSDGGMSWIRLDTKIKNNPIWDLSPGCFKTFINILLMTAQSSPVDGVLSTSKGRLRTDQRQTKIRLRSDLDQIKKLGLVSYQELKCPRGARQTDRQTDDEYNASSVSKIGGKRTSAEPASTDFFVTLFHEHAHSPLKPKTVLFLSPRERAKAHALLTQNPDPDYWRSVMRRAEQSPFLCGKTDKPFRFTMSFFLLPHTHLKIMNGDYDDHARKKKEPNPIFAQAWAEES